MENEAQVMSNALKKPKQLSQTTSMLLGWLCGSQNGDWRWYGDRDGDDMETEMEMNVKLKLLLEMPTSLAFTQ